MIRVVRKNLLIQYEADGILYGSEDHLVWQSTDQGKTWQEIFRLPSARPGMLGLMKDRLLRSALVRQWRRNIGIGSVVALPSGTVIALYDKIYRWERGGKGREGSVVFDLGRERVAGPLRGMCFDVRTNALYFGEYICARPRAIRIMRGINDGRDWQVCYTFPLGRIRHVHSIVADSFRSRLWICTGDADGESALFYSDDGCATVHWFAGGDQSWRMIGLLPLENGLLWGSDAGGDAPPNTKNHVYFLDWRTGKRDRILEVDNPFYYSMQTPSGYYMATTYEPHKQGCSSSFAELWFSSDGMSWQVLTKFPYRLNKSHGTSYATIFFPQGQTSHCLFTPVNTERFHFTTITLSERL
ncbi:MAG: hypothetical protein ACOX5Z_06030 [Desulfobulbus sp.]|jgi:hypothetical protein